VTPRFRPVDVVTRDGGGPDDLARTLLQGLERPDPRLKPAGAVGSLLAAFVSLGGLPVLLWHDRFRDFVDEERHHLRRFADWMRLHSARPETMNLRVAGEDLGCRPLLSALSVLSVVAVLVLFVASLGPAASVSRGDAADSLVNRVLDHTYRFPNSEAWQFPLSAAQRLFAAWGIGIAAAYLFHWVQVQAHVSDVRRFVSYANRIFQAQGVQRVPVPRAGVGLGVLWLVAGALLASRGAYWGLALAVAGAAQQRYMTGESPRLRRALAARVRELARLPESAGVAAARQTGPRCPHVRCLALLPRAARFCPRCGHNVDPDAERATLAVPQRRPGSHGAFDV
jgi:hypothetical protein